MRLPVVALALSICLPVCVCADDPKPSREELEREGNQLARDAARLHEKGQPVEALAKYQRLLEVLQQVYPKDKFPEGHRSIANTLASIGVMYRDMGQHTKSLPVSEQAVEMLRQVLRKENKENHPHLAISLMNLSTLLREMGKLDAAQARAEEALAIHRTLYPPDKFPNGEPILGLNLDGLASILEDQGKPEESRKLYEEARDMFARLYPKGHPYRLQTLDNLAGALKDAGRHNEALTTQRQALAMSRELFPAARFPNGHPTHAGVLSHASAVFLSLGRFEEAVKLAEEALEMQRRLFPAARFPDGHPSIATSLNNLGTMHQAMQNTERALRSLEDALAMNERLYSPARFPNGHPTLAVSISNLGHFHQSHGQIAKALEYYERALAMYRRFYPADKYPNGHPTMAAMINNIGYALKLAQRRDEAMKYMNDALSMYQRLYPPQLHPHGHPMAANCMHNIGIALHEMRRYTESRDQLQKALDMRRGLYPKSEFPNGHHELARTIVSLGTELGYVGELERAAELLNEGISMLRRLFPARDYPTGKAELAGALANLGEVQLKREKPEEARSCFEQSLRMRQADIRRLIDIGAESEVLTWIRFQPPILDAWLSLPRGGAESEREAWEAVWFRHAALDLLLERRRQAVAASSDAELKSIWDDLNAVRRSLATVMNQPPIDNGPRREARERSLRELTDRKEHLERQIAAKLPDSVRRSRIDEPRQSELSRLLPEGAVCVEFFRYNRFERQVLNGEAPGLKWTPYYLALVQKPGMPVRRVDLGPAAPIETTLAKWRTSIETQTDTPSAVELRQRVWNPIADLVGNATTVYFVPDSDLGRLPWSALPGKKPGTVLLEDHAIAVLPHAGFLLRPKTAPRTTDMLAIGGIQYDRPGGTIPNRVVWPYLPGTLREVKQIQTLDKQAVILEGTEATQARLVRDLPRARYLHLATHGFFNNELYEAEQKKQESALRDWQFAAAQQTDAQGYGARNPLGYTGIVLAGANAAPVNGDDGILSSESIVTLPLDGLELAVLSACQTGSGVIADGQCSRNLQQAFHLAGCPNVIASLWKVNDAATAALMMKFYHELLANKKDPLTALRTAQLTIYQHPELIPELSGERGAPKAKEALAVQPTAISRANGAKAPTKLWAGFVLSGKGR